MVKHLPGLKKPQRGINPYREGAARILKIKRRQSIGLGSTWGVLSRSLNAYNEILGRRIENIVLEMFSKKGVVDVLDVGSGTGYAMYGLKKIVGGKANIFGINIATFPRPQELNRRYDFYKEKFGKDFGRVKLLSENFWKFRKAFAGHWIGLAEKHGFGGKKFDLIVSVATIGSGRYSSAALENIINHLKPDGVAVIDVIFNPMTDSVQDHRAMQAAIRKAKADGLEVTLRGDVLHVHKPKSFAN